MKNIYFECSANESQRIDLVLQKIKEWMYSEPLQNIVSAFGGSIPLQGSLKDTAKWLLEFSEIWDYRRKQVNALDMKTKEKARWLITDDNITKEQAEMIDNAVEVLGLTGVNYPSQDDYDYVVVLGGARLSCLLRPKWANEIMNQKNLTPKSIVLLSGARPISDSERETTDTYAKNAKTEFDLMNAGLESVFNIRDGFKEVKHDDANINKSWAIRTYTTDKNIPVLSIAAPSTQPDVRRANSSDTFEFFFKKYNIKENAKLLLVTSEIYITYQQLEAIKTLAIPYNVVVETIGFPNHISPNLQGMRNPANYLQEIRSTINSINSFIEKYGK